MNCILTFNECKCCQIHFWRLIHQSAKICLEIYLNDIVFFINTAITWSVISTYCFQRFVSEASVERKRVCCIVSTLPSLSCWTRAHCRKGEELTQGSPSVTPVFTKLSSSGRSNQTYSPLNNAFVQTVQSTKLVRYIDDKCGYAYT